MKVSTTSLHFIILKQFELFSTVWFAVAVKPAYQSFAVIKKNWRIVVGLRIKTDCNEIRNISG